MPFQKVSRFYSNMVCCIVNRSGENVTQQLLSVNTIDFHQSDISTNCCSFSAAQKYILVVGMSEPLNGSVHNFKGMYTDGNQIFNDGALFALVTSCRHSIVLLF